MLCPWTYSEDINIAETLPSLSTRMTDLLNSVHGSLDRDVQPTVYNVTLTFSAYMTADPIYSIKYMYWDVSQYIKLILAI